MGPGAQKKDREPQSHLNGNTVTGERTMCANVAQKAVQRYVIMNSHSRIWMLLCYSVVPRLMQINTVIQILAPSSPVICACG